MRVPQVSERIREAPAQALRGVFAGIGQLLLVTDKLRNKTPTHADVPRTRTPEPSETVADTPASEPAGHQEQAAEPTRTASAPAESAPAESAPAAVKPARTRAAPKPQPARDFDKTGNVRLIRDEQGTTATPSSAPASVGAEAEAEAGVGAEVGVGAEAGAGVGAEAGAGVEAEAGGEREDFGSPPLPNYDELSVASLRARLRNLDVAQVRRLADYERSHAARPDVIAMFERRVAKLEAEA